MHEDLKRHLKSLPVPPVLDVLGVFVHLRNARTGTTSIDEGPLRGRCVMRRRDRHLWETVWDKIITPRNPVIFTFVRNPWDRVCSAFFQCRDRAKTKENQIPKTWEFNEWVKEVLAVQGPGVNMHFAEQYPTVFYNGERIGYLGFYENMEADWRGLAEVANLPYHLPHWNSAGHGSYVDHYDDMSRGIVGEMYQRDVNAFGYEFGK